MEPRKEISFLEMKNLIFSQLNSEDQKDRSIKTVKVSDVKLVISPEDEKLDEATSWLSLRNCSLELVNCELEDFFQFEDLNGFDAVACDFGILSLLKLCEDSNVSLSECVVEILDINLGYLYNFTLLNSEFDCIKVIEVDGAGTYHDFDTIKIHESLLLAYSKLPMYIDCSPDIAPLVRMACPMVPIKAYVGERLD